MSDKSSYPVPAGTITFEQEIKKSRFIATVGHAPDKESAIQFIEEVSAKHTGASHNTYAYIAGNPNGGAEVGFNDDGEIGGTAGKTILSVLQMRGIGEVVAVVTRYFGGTRLGTGGLVRAYSGTITMALDEIKLKKRVHLVEIKIVAGYEFENSIRTLFNKMGLKIKDVLYTQEVSIVADIPESISNELQSEIMDSTRGKAKILFT
ncbi:MAG: YigZ family protein [Deltaproteobacteria bacterium]|nr:YigZ family protein [Deltaproteobacteria bacterium]